MRFPIVIHKDRQSSYGVTVPDLPGCFSAGDTLDEALDSTHSATWSAVPAEREPTPAKVAHREADHNVCPGRCPSPPPASLAQRPRSGEATQDVVGNA